MPMSQCWWRPKYCFAVPARAPYRCGHWVVNALLQDCAKSSMNGVPAGSDSFWSLWYVIPWMVYVGGQVTADCGVRIPALNSAVEVMTFIEEPGATAAVSAKSLKPSLLAPARMSPAGCWMTTIGMLGCMAN